MPKKIADGNWAEDCFIKRLTTLTHVDTVDMTRVNV